MKVKICGLKTKEAVDTAVKHGADFIGFVFAESKRKITPEAVRKITEDVPSGVKKVGVFVSPSLEELEQVIETAGLDMVQIHGRQLVERPSVPLISAVSVSKKTEPLVGIQTVADYLLFDAPPKEYAGGNGETFDWEQLDIEQVGDKKVFIAGGLTIENVQQAKAVFQPYAVDVSSGVETNGEKDLEKISRFLEKAKGDI
ncbi:phosphoribosylanthranilate isomerase [Enterococcus sp. BWR-S5]|uniref:phosphoribosylanthranilate isomerase n=1 Tax=Enterococcus sp. BWR-S5 TaxID=2787714 RepID=UPI001920567A|nr:phosphoribosylanthranilate isomerase [Enterococcus sp. BWR-S5]MBL1226762.1 phosphoribosylanthranilate isomerase [Enterococcus sp. BWR-S5]